MGWASRRNGDLLALAQGQFDVFLTVDRNLSAEQELSRFNVAVMVMVAKSNRLADLRPLVPQVQSMLLATLPGQVIRVGG